MATLHIGKHRVQVLTATDGSTIPPGTVTATTDAPGLIGLSVDPVTNDVTVTGLAATSGAGATVTYSAPGYLSATEGFQVSPLPSIIVTDGPEE